VTQAMQPPAADEYGTSYAGYVSQVPPGTNILEFLARQQADMMSRFRVVPETRGGHRYAPGKWSVKELVVHLSDVERIFTYRALRVARSDATPLPGFDENTYAPASGADAQPLEALVSEWCAVRQATIALFRHLPPDAWLRRGTASGQPVSVRALAWMTAGHVRHHLGVLEERYGLWTAPMAAPRATS
jgi:hypothetical protein